MSFFLKQAINALTTETSDLQDILDQKAEAAQTYTMNEVNGKFTDLIGAAPATLDTLKEIANAVNNDGTFAVTINKSIDAKAPIADPTFTGTATFTKVAGITKDMVGLGNVDNTTDAAKVVSTKTQAALNTKEAVIITASPLVKGYQFGGPDDGKMLLSLAPAAVYTVGSLKATGNAKIDGQLTAGSVVTGTLSCSQGFLRHRGRTLSP